MNIQEIQINEFPVVIFTDTHTNLANIKKLRGLYPKSQFICLGDITFLWNQKDNFNKLSVQYFIDHKIPVLKGNHEDFIVGVDEGNRLVIGNVTNKNLSKFNLEAHQVQFLKELPRGFRLNLPNGEHYLCFHNLPDDLWAFKEAHDLSKLHFSRFYPINDKTVAVLHGHLHKHFIVNYEGLKTARISLGPLSKEGCYTLLTQNGLEFKNI